MNADHPISLLIWFTFAAVIAVAVFALLHFRRKRSNRHPMEGKRERNIDEIRRDGPTS